ncbi:MAG: sulfatase-like hydrolase/transferase [Verrucomicrobia bacterium]|nr:sulfatase-like hydrolase/transferase [Verrucomicrobiota bacterium]
MKHHLLLSALLLSTLASLQAADSPKPNVVYLFADDLGWSDISAHPGGTIKTPNIDKLFKQGLELKNFMGWCVCSPTRAMLLTGRHPFRVGTGPETGGELEKAETTIAEGFKANGYHTGVFGKWHNGEDPDSPEYRTAFAEAFKSMPNKKPASGLGANEHGFDEAWVYYGGGADYFTRRTSGGKGPVSWWHNREFRAQDAGYTEDFIVQHAMDFIRDNKEKPFFCYVPFHLVHAPMQAKDSDLKDVDPAVTDETKRTYAAMVQALDKNVGAILAELDKNGLRDNTIVVFTSDNGATKDGSNLPFRGGKHSVYEGGTHLPTAIHWPKGKVAGGSWDGLCGALDMFPTLMAMADLKMPETRPLDGKNIWPALRDNTASPVESYYWSWHNEDAIRTADWRLHRYFDHNELYNIRTDIGETTDVAAANPKVVQSLVAKMNAWADSLGAALTHQPVPMQLDAKPAPEGEVLEVTVTVNEGTKPKDQLVVPIASVEGNQSATDYIEYDIAIAPESLRRGFFYAPFKGNDSKAVTLHFKRGEGIDQFGREQSTAPEVQGKPGTWEHRVIGLCSSAPGSLPRHGLVFKGGKPGTYKVYLDNLRLRHADGSTTPIWMNGKDTRAKKIADSEFFKGVQVRAVNADKVVPLFYWQENGGRRIF